MVLVGSIDLKRSFAMAVTRRIGLLATALFALTCSAAYGFNLRAPSQLSMALPVLHDDCEGMPDCLEEEASKASLAEKAKDLANIRLMGKAKALDACVARCESKRGRPNFSYYVCIEDCSQRIIGN
jgi:hypothetical protein